VKKFAAEKLLYLLMALSNIHSTGKVNEQSVCNKTAPDFCRDIAARDFLFCYSSID
jgi:hypothetical protein